VTAAFYLAVSLAVTYINLGSTIQLPSISWADAPFLFVLGLHYLWGGVLFISSTEFTPIRRARLRRLYFVPELLGTASLLLFLFSFIFALNANLDYVQRFVEGGTLRLALDTQTERLLVWSRVFPLVALNAGVYLLLRVGRYRAAMVAACGHASGRDPVAKPWAFVLTLASAFLMTIAFPSFVSLDGFPLLGWVALVPLFIALRSARFGHGVFYLTTFGVLATLLTNYWLATFSLVSLQITVAIFLVYYLVFSPLALAIYRVAGRARFLVFPLAFTLFEYLRSTGFLGYPWALFGHTQYSVIPLIQIAEVTGVWGISFVVLLGNAALAELLGSLKDAPARSFQLRNRLEKARGPSLRQSLAALAGSAAAIGAVLLFGTVLLAVNAASDVPERTVRVAQIQQNNDPRRNEYERTFDTLQRLTERTLPADPDIIFWSETAFVPNIRRWERDRSSRRFHRLVTEFLRYQDELGHWLLTGNDDYERVVDSEGVEADRLNYNAAVLFDDQGRRRETYRKIRLVPFTEHFPYRDTFPWVYDLLLEYEVMFWEEGDELTVFEHPLMRFSTPICYEDVFPDYVRRFVLEGAEVLANISNDYWSLAEVQAKQHFVAGLFRAVENRRPVIRTTSSGLTGYIDELGRVRQTAPYFEEVALVTEVSIREDQPLTFYTRAGDYFPLLAAGGLALILLGSLGATLARRRRVVPAPPPRAASGAVTTPERPRDESAPQKSAQHASDDSERLRKKKRRRRARRKGKKFDWRAIWDD
jgi:apolipoprotein N-acyltransferase